MGRDKSLLEIHGKTLIETAAALCTSVLDDVIVVSDTGYKYGFTGFEEYADIYPDRGPLAGIHSALEHSASPWLLVLTCDMPFVTKQALEYLLDAGRSDEVTVFSEEGRMHPFPGLYTRNIIPDLDAVLKQGPASVTGFIGSVAHRVIPVSRELPFFTSELLRNINTPQEYQNHVSHGQTSGESS